MNVLDCCSVHSGVAISDEECLISLMNDDLSQESRQHSIPLLFRGDLWSSIEEEPVLPWITAGTGIGRPHESLLVGWAGQVLAIDGAGSRREALIRTDSLPVSIIRAVSSIDGATYIAGMSRQVYERTVERDWTDIDHDVVNAKGEFGVGFNAIDGFARGEIYAAGMNGELWCYAKTIWHQIDSPVGVHLHSMCCGEDGFVYVGGRAGVLLKGRRDTWDVLDLGIDATVWDVHWFRGILYVISKDGIYRYNEGVVERVGTSLADGDFVNFSSAGQKLWAFGPKRIIWYDGSTWGEQSVEIAEENVDEGLLGFLNNDVVKNGSTYLED
jgi:hypothetical protein